MFFYILSIKVRKEIPSMCIILSKIPLDVNENGYVESVKLEF